MDRGVRRRRVLKLGAAPLTPGGSSRSRLATRTTGVRVQAIRHRIDVGTLEPQPAAAIAATEVARVTLRAHDLLALDDFAALPATGRFVLRDGFVTVGGGSSTRAAIRISTSRAPLGRTLRRCAARSRTAEREARLGHAGAVIWFTGLSAAGKSTLAMGLERGALRSRLRRVRPRRRQHPPRAQRQPPLFAGGPAGEHPAHRRGRGALRRRGVHLHRGLHLAVPRRPAARARGRARRAFLRSLRARRPGRVRARAIRRACTWKARHGELKDFTGSTARYEEPEAPRSWWSIPTPARRDVVHRGAVRLRRDAAVAPSGARPASAVRVSAGRGPTPCVAAAGSSGAPSARRGTCAPAGPQGSIGSRSPASSGGCSHCCHASFDIVLVDALAELAGIRRKSRPSASRPSLMQWIMLPSRKSFQVRRSS